VGEPEAHDLPDAQRVGRVEAQEGVLVVDGGDPPGERAVRGTERLAARCGSGSPRSNGTSRLPASSSASSGSGRETTRAQACIAEAKGACPSRPKGEMPR
jgi:hypothetical protein